MNSTLFQLSSGFLTAALAVTVTFPAAALAVPSLEADALQVQTIIEEWHWRDMDH
ncbi:MAG: hypothetical protein AAF821_12380 [Cyanobacteria bacterium P01_D01_bin.156]